MERESNKKPKSIWIFSEINQGVRVIFKEFSFKAIWLKAIIANNVVIKIKKVDKYKEPLTPNLRPNNPLRIELNKGKKIRDKYIVVVKV